MALPAPAMERDRLPPEAAPASWWWTPARFVIPTRTGWKTIPPDQYIGNAHSWQAVAISPIGMDGMVHFVASDVDSGSWVDVEAILRVLPREAVPLVSFSGKKGWHLWLFPAEPLPADVAVTFAAEVRRAAGIPCEAFPTSRNSRCLKWPGSYHPETGVQEAFVDIRTGGATELDTPAVLEMLAAGMLRTSTQVFYQVAARSPLAPPVLTGRLRDRPASSSDNQAPIKQDAKQNASNLLGKIGAPARDPSLLDSLARSEELVAWLMRQAGRKPVPVGRSFWCILHRERHPSAAFHRAQDGKVIYHDMHASKYGTPEWLTLGSLYAALRTGHTRKLRRHEAATWLAKAGIEANLVPPSTFNTTLLANSTFQAWGAQLGKQHDMEISHVAYTPEADPLPRVWEAVLRLDKVQRVCGYDVLLASQRFMAKEAGVAEWAASRCMNLLCVLGFLEKLPSTGRGDRWRLSTPSLEDVLRRWDLLGKPSLREFNGKLVAERLGEDVAAKVFRR